MECYDHSEAAALRMAVALFNLLKKHDYAVQQFTAIGKYHQSCLLKTEYHVLVLTQRVILYKTLFLIYYQNKIS